MIVGFTSPYASSVDDLGHIEMGFLTIFGPLLVQMLKTIQEFTRNVKHMKQSVASATAFCKSDDQEWRRT
jgi:hypothetical protein